MSGLSSDNRNARLGVITASAWAKIRKGGNSRVRELKRIAEERETGQSQEPKFSTKAMSDGVAAEPKILSAFEAFLKEQAGLNKNVRHNQDLITRTIGENKVGATPDGIMGDEWGVVEPVEVKFPKFANFGKQIEKLPPDYQAQAKFQAFVLQTRHANLVLAREMPNGDMEIAPHKIPFTRMEEEEYLALVADAEREIAEIRNNFGEAAANPKVAAVARAKRATKDINDGFKAAKAILEKKRDEMLAAYAEFLNHEEDVCKELVEGSKTTPPGIKRTQTKAVVCQTDSLPPQFVKRTPEIAKIKKALESGEPVEGATLENRTSYSILPAAADESDAEQVRQDLAQAMSALTEAADGDQNNKTEKKQ